MFSMHFIYCLIILIFSILQNSVLAQDSKDVLYGLPPLPLTPEEQATTTRRTTPAPRTTLFFHKFFTLPHFTPPPLPRELPYIDTYGINPLAERPPQPESKYDGHFDDDGNFVPRKKTSKEVNEEKEFAREQIVKNQIHGVKTFTEKTPIFKRDLSTTIEGTTTFNTPTTIATTIETKKSPSIFINSTAKNHDNANVVGINKEEGNGGVFDETSLKLSEVPVLQQKSVSTSSEGNSEAVIISKHVAGKHDLRALAARKSRQDDKILNHHAIFDVKNGSNGKIQAPPQIQIQIQPATIPPSSHKLKGSKRRLKITKMNHNTSTESPHLKFQQSVQQDFPITTDQKPPRAKFLVSNQLIRRQNLPQKGNFQTSINTGPKTFIPQRTTTPLPQPPFHRQRQTLTQKAQLHQTSHVELPPLNLPKFGQKLAQNLGNGQQNFGKPWRLDSSTKPVVTGRAWVSNTRLPVGIPSKLQKPNIGSFRDIPPVPQDDIIQVQKNFVRVAPTLPTPQVVPSVKAQFPQASNQFQPRPVQQQFVVPTTRIPPRPVVTTLPPPPKNHPIQQQYDNREPIVREYLANLEDYDWHLHYAEQNINTFGNRFGNNPLNGRMRHSGVQQVQLSQGQQPNAGQIKEFGDYDDSSSLQQILERRNNFAANPPQLHVDLPSTASYPYYNVIETTTQDSLVPFDNSRVPAPPPQNFGNQQGQYGPTNNNYANNNYGYNNNNYENANYGPQSQPLITPPPTPVYHGPTPHPLLNYVHGLLGFNGPHPLSTLFGR